MAQYVYGITNCGTSTGKDVPEQLMKHFQRQITELRSTVQCLAWVRKTTQINVNVKKNTSIGGQRKHSFTLRQQLKSDYPTAILERKRAYINPISNQNLKKGILQILFTFEPNTVVFI